MYGFERVGWGGGVNELYTLCVASPPPFHNIHRLDCK